MLLRLLLDLADVRLVVPLVVFLLVLLAQAIVVLRRAVVCVLVAHDLGTLRLGLLDSFAVLVLVMLHFLQVRDNQCVVRLLLLLHLRVEVLDLGLELLDFLPRVLVKVMNHVFFDLERVSLHFRIGELLTQVLDRNLQLFSTHGEELILWLGFFLLFLSLLLLLASHCGVSLLQDLFFTLKFKSDKKYQ